MVKVGNERARRYAAGTLAAALMLSGSPLVTATAKTPLDAAAKETLYSDATVIDGTGAAPRPHQDLLIRGDRIVAIGQHDALTANSSARRVDEAGKFIIPGLIDSHVHLATPPNNAQAKAVLRRDLYGGVTAVRDMADDLRPIAEYSREALTGEIPAPDIYSAVLMAGPSWFADPRTAAANAGATPGLAPWMQAISPQTNIPEAIARARGTSATAIKIYADLPPALVDALTHEAHRQHMLVWAHSAVFPTRPSEVLAAGVDVASHVCYLGFEHDAIMPRRYEDRAKVNEASFPSQGDDRVLASLYREMKQRGQILDATGSIFVGVDRKRRTDPKVPILRCSGALVTRMTRQAWRAGVPISTGTDSIAGSGSVWPEMYEEMLFLARDVGMPTLQVLRSATLVGARAAGQARDMGSLEPGKLANFVVLQANPVVDIRNMRSVETVVKRGKAFSRVDYRPATKAEIVDDDFPVSSDAVWTGR